MEDNHLTNISGSSGILKKPVKFITSTKGESRRNTIFNKFILIIYRIRDSKRIQ